LDLALLTYDAAVAAAPGINGTTPSSSTSGNSSNGAQSGNDTTKTLMARMEELDFDDLFV